MLFSNLEIFDCNLDKDLRRFFAWRSSGVKAELGLCCCDCAVGLSELIVLHY